MSVVSRSVAGSAVAGSVRIPGRYRTPIPRTLLVVAVLVVVAVASLVFGSYQMSPDQVFRLIFQGEGTEIERQLVLNQRLPRMLAAVVVGAALGLSGAIFQSVSRNALGSPDIIGFTNGAATGALLQIIVFNSGPVEVALGAVIGGLATSVLVWLLTRRTGLHGFRLVLVGIGVGSTLAAFNALLVVRASLTQAQTAASWLAGSLNDITWERTYALMGLLLVVTPLLLMLVRPLGAIRFGDQVASGLGVSVNAYRVAALFIGVLLVSLATATTGPIAFVALAAPHIAKTLSRSGGVGFTSAALMGALMVLGSDLIGRFAVPGRIIQVGVVTGAIGGLYLIYLIYLERKKS